MKILKIIGLILGVLVIIGVFVIAFYTYRTSDGYARKITAQATAKNNSTLCDHIFPRIGNPDNQDGCYQSVAIQNNNIQACESKGWNCYAAYFRHFLAINEGDDAQACDPIVGSWERDECRIQQAHISQKLELCQFIGKPSGKASCYSNYARRTGDIKICDLYLTDQHDKNICYRVVNQ